jgi:hypothetical protein
VVGDALRYYNRSVSGNTSYAQRAWREFERLARDVPEMVVIAVIGFPEPYETLAGLIVNDRPVLLVETAGPDPGYVWAGDAQFIADDLDERAYAELVLTMIDRSEGRWENSPGEGGSR